MYLRMLTAGLGNAGHPAACRFWAFHQREIGQGDNAHQAFCRDALPAGA
jgi:hypothetical protein